jgi:hypothetical protein
MKGFNVHIDSRLVENKQPTESYGEWYSKYNNIFKSIYPTETAPDVVTSLDINVEDIVYVIWLERSTGDSFGWGENTEVDVVGVFTDLIIAKQFKNFIESTKEIDLYQTNEALQKQLKSIHELQPPFKIH